MGRTARLGATLAVALTLGCSGDEGPTGPSFPTLQIVTAQLANGAPTLTYRAELEATGGNGSFSWSITTGSLPDGLSLSGSGGVISGRPLQSGTSSFTLQVTSGDGQTASRQLSVTVDPICDELPGSAVVTFADPDLAAAVRAGLGIGAQDDITCGATSGLTTLYAIASDVESLVGLQNLTSLTGLYLNDNTIQDVSPISGLVQLQILVLGGNEISDISLLSELSTALWDLDVGRNPVNNISALASLTGMTKLYVNETSVTDIGPLQGLTDLGDLDLADNANLTDIGALLNNPGLGQGDQVFLTGTGVSCADITALAAKGVNVISDCP